MSTSFASEEKHRLSFIKKKHLALATVSLRSVARWTQRRTRGQILESIRIGGQAMTSLQAVDRFLAAINSPPDAPAAPRSPHERQRASEAAAQELALAGA